MDVRTLLLDTNVWISFFLGDRPNHEAVRSLLRKSLDENWQLSYAVVSVKDAYYAICADLKRNVLRERGEVSESVAAAANETAWGCVASMTSLAVGIPCDHTDIAFARGLKRLHGDFEDDLVLAAAARGRADLLVTNDEKLLRHSPVPAMDVKDALAYLDCGSRSE